MRGALTQVIGRLVDLRPLSNDRLRRSRRVDRLFVQREYCRSILVALALDASQS